MKLKHKREKKIPQLNTSALPDLVFTVLFFFMIVTHMRQNDVKVQVTVPEGEQLQQFQKKHATATIYVGKSSDGKVSIQVDNTLTDEENLAKVLLDERNMMADVERDEFTVALKADRDVPIGVIAEIKTILQKINVLHVNYSATGQNVKEEVFTNR